MTARGSDLLRRRHLDETLAPRSSSGVGPSRGVRRGGAWRAMVHSGAPSARRVPVEHADLRSLERRRRTPNGDPRAGATGGVRAQTSWGSRAVRDPSEGRTRVLDSNASDRRAARREPKLDFGAPGSRSKDRGLRCSSAHGACPSRGPRRACWRGPVTARWRWGRAPLAARSGHRSAPRSTRQRREGTRGGGRGSGAPATARQTKAERGTRDPAPSRFEAIRRRSRARRRETGERPDHARVAPPTPRRAIGRAIRVGASRAGVASSRSRAEGRVGLGLSRCRAIHFTKARAARGDGDAGGGTDHRALSGRRGRREAEPDHRRAEGAS